jgi:hypothetical protein
VDGGLLTGRSIGYTFMAYWIIQKKKKSLSDLVGPKGRMLKPYR